MDAIQAVLWVMFFDWIGRRKEMKKVEDGGVTSAESLEERMWKHGGVLTARWALD